MREVQTEIKYFILRCEICDIMRIYTYIIQVNISSAAFLVRKQLKPALQLLSTTKKRKFAD